MPCLIAALLTVSVKGFKVRSGCDVYVYGDPEVTKDHLKPER